MATSELLKWIESAPGPFEGVSRGDVWQTAYADFYGKDIGGFDLGFMLSVNKLGFYERCAPSGGYVLEMDS